MGCFSVYCGISRIAITAGMRCCVLPIAEPNVLYESHGKLPTMLPVFGEYDDYGGIEDIERNSNTELIEQHFGVTVDEFCHYFTRGCTSNDDVSDKLKGNNELAAMDFMFVHGDVWDVMSSSRNPSDLGRFGFGNPHILKLLGFEYVGTTPDSRYKHAWRRGEKTLWCDGTWCEPSIYSMSGWGETGFDEVIGIRPEDEWLLNEDDISILSRIGDEEYLVEKLGGAIGGDYRIAITVKRMQSLTADIDVSDIADTASIRWKYMSHVLEFREQLQKVARVVRNMRCMSGEFLPHSPCVTPQCGDHKRHQHFLDAFAEINRSIVKDESEYE